MDERESWQRALDMAQRSLATLEEQAAAYTSLTIRPELVIELADKRREVARLKSLLAGNESKVRPCHLPRRVPFFGRETEIARALEALSPEDRGWGLMIDGIGGIGKTALAVEVAYQAYEQARFDVVLFTTTKQTRLTPTAEQAVEDSAASLDAMLSEFARDLGETGVAQQAGSEKRRALLDALRSHSSPQRRLLLILDNLETLPEDDLAPLFSFLRRLPGDCKAIVTSRRRAGEGAVWLRLEKLDWLAACDLIADEARRAERLARILDPERDRWQELYDAAGGSPLALHWILGLMRGRNLSLDRALALLRQGETADSPLHQFIYREARRDMAADDWRVLGALSLFAAPASFEALASVSDLSRLALESALERLDAYALVDAAGPDGPYSLHPLTRQLAAAELGAQPDTVWPLCERFAEYWVGYAKHYGGSSENYRTFDRLRAEWPNLEAAAVALRSAVSVPGALRDRKAAMMLNDLINSLRFFVIFQGYWDERERLGEWAYEANVVSGDWASAGWRAYEIARTHYSRGDKKRAAIWAGLCTEAMERGGTRRGRIFATRLCGFIAEQKGDLQEAERFYKEATTGSHQLGHEIDTARILNDLGRAVHQQGEYDRASLHYLEALDILEQRNQVALQPAICGNLGSLNLLLGNLADARRWHQRQLVLAQETNQVGEFASAQAGLARVLEKEDRPVEAQPLAEEALRIHERLGHKDLAETRDLVARLRAAAATTDA
jgi:tetratricopeptide (TPR) repeat protein